MNRFLQIANLTLQQPVAPCPAIPPNIHQTLDDSNLPIIHTYGLSATEDPVSLHETQIVCGTNNACASNHQASGDNLDDGLSPVCEATPEPNFLESDAHAVLLAADQCVKMIADAAGQLADAAAHIIELVNAKKPDEQKRDGLLHFREWWELAEVQICVGGNILCGMPILIEEGAIRIIDKNHSHFIPLEKVDYIRTNDGLCTSFHSAGDQRVGAPS